jgi:prephenate dehydrogenase
MKVVVSGLGEMGASLALALKQNNNAIEIIGVDVSSTTLKKAQDTGLASQVDTDLTQVAPNADVIILAGPTKVIIEQLSELANCSLKENVLVTDTGSTKVQVLNAAQALLEKGIHFAGGHAMAGTQKAGINAVDAHLYEHAPYFIVGPDQNANEQLQKLLTPLKLTFIKLSATKHDEMMAYLSDLPHIVAAGLVNSTRDALQEFPDMPNYAAGGFKDTTRIGGADPKMWTDILTTNREATLKSLKQFEMVLKELEVAVAAEDEHKIHDFFASSKQLRQQFEE